MKKTYLIEMINCFDVEAESYDEALEKIHNDFDFNDQDWQDELVEIHDENGNVIDDE